jgi:sec-independent protein translocase protein TatB
VFDVGFSELVVIGIVALVVIGPERLPRVARTAGHLFGRLQRYVAQVKSDINREIEAAELGKVKTEFESAARSFESEVQSHTAAVEQGMRDVQAGLDRSLEEAAVPPVPETPADAPAPSPQLELPIGESVNEAAPGKGPG